MFDELAEKGLIKDPEFADIKSKMQLPFLIRIFENRSQIAHKILDNLIGGALTYEQLYYFSDGFSEKEFYKVLDKLIEKRILVEIEGGAKKNG